MNVVLLTVALMLCVPTLLEASPVHVTKDTLEMEPFAWVLSYHKMVMYVVMAIVNPNRY